jgi:hypothetical protein
MAEPIARQSMIIRRSPAGVALQFVARLICPTIATGMVAALLAIADTPADVPPGCGITWTMVGHTVIFLPDCKHPAQSSPNRPPSGNQPQPQQEPPSPPN